METTTHMKKEFKAGDYVYCFHREIGTILIKTMELQQEKARFFAQYWGQEIGVVESVFEETISNLIIDQKTFEDIDYLELKTLSSISDEDAIEVARIYNKSINGGPFPRWFTDEDYISCGKSYIMRKEITIDVFDYLRYKRYALPFDGRSVEELVELGWIKLK